MSSLDKSQQTSLSLAAVAMLLDNPAMANIKRTRVKRLDWHQRELLRPSEVAELMGESRSGVYARIARGQIPAIRLGKSLRVPRIKLEEMITKLIRRSDRKRALRRNS